ncbi:MAG: zinc dependent phospholipase C family protein [Clostridia bacterium]|nr:zinc dependent phospholipase C family protein [Clostridia bacterium]
MKKFVQILSIVLSCTLLFGIGCISAAAEECEGDKYLPDFVLEIANGSENTLGEINEMDRYQRAYEAANLTVGGEYAVKFNSGGADHTHQYICANALRILANDKGDSVFNQSSNASLLLEGADWPDKSDMGFIFDTHFYDPYKETNWMGGSTTAKVKAQNYYDDAISYYRNGNVTSALQSLGRGSHFVQDACEAHHATNKTAVNSNHSAYESYIDGVRTEFTIPNNSFNSNVYEEAKYCTAARIVRNNGYASYVLGDRVTVSSSSPDYYDAARSTVCNGILATTQYFYKFAYEVGIMS